MVSVASATKRRAGLGTKKKAAKKAPRSRGATAASTVVVGAKLSMQNSTTTRTIQLAPPDASVSEKRRVAAGNRYKRWLTEANTFAMVRRRKTKEEINAIDLSMNPIHKGEKYSITSLQTESACLEIRDLNKYLGSIV